MGDGQRSVRAGLLYGVGAYGFWGMMPLYFKAVGETVGPWEFLAHRIVWCFLLLCLVLTLFRRWTDFGRVVRSPRLVTALAASAVLVAVNWLIYIHGVSTRQIVQTSLGYFINPLFSVVLGLVFFRERLRSGQWLAVGFAAAGIVYMVLAAGEAPWIALGLALSFGLYGLMRKMTPVDGLIGLTVETLLLAPLAVSCLLWWASNDALSWGRQGAWGDTLVALSGVVTAIPLLCFGQAARRLPLSTLGFLQYLAPTAQFLLAVILYGELFERHKQIGFGFVWLALAVFTVDSLLRRPAPAAAAMACD